MIKLVLFDFDETICMTEEACFHLENETAQSMGFSPMSREIHQSTWGKPLKNAITIRVPGIDPETFMTEVMKRSKKYLHDGRLDSIGQDRLKVFDELIAMGKKIAILTSRTYDEVEHLIDPNHVISEKVEQIYHMEEGSYVKPDPRVFDKPLADFNCLPEEAVYIGDAVSDAQAANGAGLHFIAYIESTIRDESQFAGHHVDFFAYSFEDVLKYLQD